MRRHVDYGRAREIDPRQSIRFVGVAEGFSRERTVERIVELYRAVA